MASNRRQQNLDFRREDVEWVTQRWRATTSCSMVGIGSAGKSNLLQHLTDPRVQAHYLGDEAKNLKTIIIDANMLGPLPSASVEADQVRCWAGYELLMNRLFLAFYPLNILGDEASVFFETYQRLQDGTNPLYAYMALRYFELGLTFFLNRDFKIVFMFDEFEELLKQIPVKFFQTLRGLRDTHKRQLCFMTFTRSPLVTVLERYNIPLLEIEPFIELFNDNIHYIGPYNPTDAEAMVDELARRRNRYYSSQLVNNLMQVTGRYAGVMRAGFNALEEFPNVDLNQQSAEQLAKLLFSRPSIKAECKTIWTSLNRSEQYVLKAVARLTSYNVSNETELAVNMLIYKKLLRLTQDGQNLEIDPAIFRLFVLTNPETT